MKTGLLTFCLLFFVSSLSFSQITGVIISSENQEPIVGAGIYVSNTSFGTFSDIDGNFSLIKYPDKNFTLNFSSVGFVTKTVEINPKEIKNLKVSLTPKVEEIEAVVVIGERENLWEEYGDFFFDLFIGYSSIATNCVIENKDDIFFDYNEKDKILTAYAIKPIKITNKKLGYSITYWLEDFQYHYNGGKLFIIGFPFFQDLYQERKLPKRVAKQREKAYQGSFIHFIHSIYKNELNENGFLVNNMQRRPISELYPPESKIIDTLNFANSRTGFGKIESYLPERNKAIFINKVFEWKTKSQDSLYRLKVYHKINDESVIDIFEFWDKKGLQPNQTMLTRYRENKRIEKKGVKGLYELIEKNNIKQEDFVVNLSESQKAFRFDNFLQVYFLLENEELEFQQRKGKEIKKESQYSVLSIVDTEQMLIFNNGLVDNPYQLLLEYYWPYERIDKMLPLDYKSNN